ARPRTDQDAIDSVSAMAARSSPRPGASSAGIRREPEDQVHRLGEDLPGLHGGPGGPTAIRSASADLANRGDREGDPREPAPDRGSRSGTDPVGAAPPGKRRRAAEGDRRIRTV